MCGLLLMQPTLLLCNMMVSMRLMRMLSAVKKHTTTFCGKCTENVCAECIDPYCTHIVGTKLFTKHRENRICCACSTVCSVRMVLGLLWLEGWHVSGVLL